MSFENPSAFFLLILLPILMFIQHKRRRQDAITYSSVQILEGFEKTWRQRLLFLPPLFLYTALVLIICALADPVVEFVNERQDRQGIAIEILIDVSSSMDFEIRYGDKEDRRMEVAKKVVEEFIIGNDKDLSGRPDDLIGIITFARYPDTICPMTLGHDAVVQMVRELKVNERPNEDGTAYADAIALGVARLDTMALKGGDEDIASKVIILLTDGENNSGSYLPEEAGRFAESKGIKVYAIRIKSEPKDEIRRNADGTLSGPPEKSPSAKVLENIAHKTGGIYREAYSYDSLSAVYKKINELEKTRMKAVNFTDTRAAFHYFAVFALACLTLQYLLSSTVLRVSP